MKLTMQKLGRNLFVTEDGCKALGKFVREYRMGLLPEMRLEDLQAEIIKETGYEICSVSTLSKFETGKQRFDTNLCAAIAAVLRIKNPLKETCYDGRDFDEVARENLDLSTGLPPKKKRSK